MLMFGCVHGCREGVMAGIVGVLGLCPGLVGWLPGEPGWVKRRVVGMGVCVARLAALDAGG